VAALAVASAATGCGKATSTNDAPATSSPSTGVTAGLKSLAEAAGHPVTLDLDAKITGSRTRAEIETMVTEAARAAALDLRRLQREDAYVFARVVLRLERIAYRYGDAAPEARWDGTTLVLTRLYRWELLGKGDLSELLRTSFYGELERRFAGVEPERVSPPERVDYLVYLTHARPGPSRNARPPEAAIERVIRLASLAGASDGALAAEIRGWLLSQANDVANPSRAEGQTPEARRAHAAWAAWLNATLPSATPAEKLVVARAAFGETDVYADKVHRVERQIEGFDTFAFGLGVADGWLRAGHPTTQAPGDPAFDLVDYVVCPPIYERDGRLSRGDGDHSPWVRRAFGSAAEMSRLSDAMAARNDPVLVAAVLYNLPYQERDHLPVRANLLKDLERYPRTWQLAMLRLVEEERQEGCDAGLVEEANHAWRDVPALRGTALHVIACREARYRGVSDSFFTQFPRLYDQSIDAPLLRAFLDDGPDAMKLADALWPAMTKGWSKVGVVVPKLDAFLADPKVRGGQDGEPMQTLLAINKRLCQDGNMAEVSRFHDALASRARADVEKARALAKVVDETQPGRCERKRR
jgi:hypothetical protein